MVTCFLLTETDRAKRGLRRYVSSSAPACPRGYHNAITWIEEILSVKSDKGFYGPAPLVDDAMRADPRWPLHCEACGYLFEPGDAWQIFDQQIYRAADGREMILRDAPAGAMWFVDYEGHFDFDSVHHKARGGGPHLHVRTPGGDWDIDSKSSNGDGWQRSGEPPVVTAHPSIICGTYHGWLRHGHLTPA